MNQISKIIFLIFLLSKVNYAQNQDQEAKSLLDEVNSKINSYNNIQISCLTNIISIFIVINMNFSILELFF